MAVDENCSTCGDTGLIECPCCCGKGGCTRNFHPMNLIKGYLCSYCAGAGKTQCPQCNTVKLSFQEPMMDLFSWLLKTLFPKKDFL